MLVREPVDFRKSIDGLAAVCELMLSEKPLDGSLYVFSNRRRRSVKMLMWTFGGFSLLYKRLEKGRFLWPSFQGKHKLISQAELLALLEGIDLTSARRATLWKPKKVEKSLARWTQSVSRSHGRTR